MEVALEVSWRSIWGVLGVNLRVCPELLGNKFVFSYVDTLRLSDSQTLNLSDSQTLRLSHSQALTLSDPSTL